MKKFFLALFIFFTLQLNAFAGNGISFVYINGSNVHDSEINKWYRKGIQKFHPCIKKAFEQNCSAQKFLLKDGQYIIEDSPIMFFWGDKCYKYSAQAEKNFSLSKGFSTFVARQVRYIATNVLHDVFWVKQHNNKTCVLDDLHKIVQIEAQKGNKIILYGYSSGSIVAYEYLLNKTPYINVADFFNSANVSKQQRDFANQHPMKNTCMSAIERKLATFSADGHFIFNNDLSSFEKNYMSLNEETDNACIPCNSVLGIINIASPLALFYTDVADSTFQMTYYNRLLYKYIFENDMFWLTENYREDGLSFPCAKNLTIEEVERITNLDIEPHAGFIYNQSNTRGGFLAMTHMHYLSSKKALSKIIVNAYVKGHKYQCENGNKQKTINNCQKKADIMPLP